MCIRDSYMVLLSLSFDSLHGILRRLYDEMTELCQPMMTLATAIAALGALFYIAYRVWQSLSRAEPVDVFGMLRPFCLGICILFFDVIVLGSLNGILSPVVQGTGAMLHDQTFDVRKFQEEKDRLLSEMPLKVAVTGEFNPTDEELEKEIADMGWNGEDYAVMQRMSHTCYSFSLQSIVQTIMCKVMEFLFRAASLVVDTIRTFFLIVLSVLGPIAFAISVFDGFQGTLVQWLARYISVYLWLPISDLLGVMLARIQTLVLQSEMEMIRDPLSVFSPDGSTAIYLVFMLIGLVGYFCVPTVANWVVQAGGMGAYNRNMNNTAGKAANVGGAVAGASTGNVAGVLLKK